ncbi:flagellar biosynthesis anti-sigma factor FlgM [Budviciaceae bacterium BWR-B9]|uniref:Anti-sigma-28 factor n=1 Tax=Limnobaculum allomyrinae TaxID=2791986 RepID=A0ABS1INE6_9GAMM|nr:MULTISPECIES: flagellar biosynthesis anti-sigma factor FlgM [Limnobaculum]MBK5143278.1 flagellar biosynthesis anti-sigma factor FlgM [Limnobaculum allomyrinae]MBV7691166.1 flagellar biosynthesis anti-sigma factor FlgM [Limnobaculum sp. M2-1]
MKAIHTQETHPHLSEYQSKNQLTLAKKSQESHGIQKEEVSLSQLKEALRILAILPEIDIQKVTTIKTALKLGRIGVNPEHIASAILEYYRGADK